MQKSTRQHSVWDGRDVCLSVPATATHVIKSGFQPLQPFPSVVLTKHPKYFLYHTSRHLLLLHTGCIFRISPVLKWALLTSKDGNHRRRNANPGPCGVEVVYLGWPPVGGWDVGCTGVELWSMSELLAWQRDKAALTVSISSMFECAQREVEPHPIQRGNTMAASSGTDCLVFLGFVSLQNHISRRRRLIKSSPKLERLWKRADQCPLKQRLSGETTKDAAKKPDSKFRHNTTQTFDIIKSPETS